MVRNKSGCKWREILLFSRWKPQGPRQQSHSELFFAFSYQHFNIFLEAHLISSGFCIWLSKALHISYLISWDLHCEIWFERKLSMVIIVIHFILQWQTKTKQVSQNIYPQSTNLYFYYFSYQISQTDAQPFFLNWLQSSLDILGTDESKNRTFPN